MAARTYGISIFRNGVQLRSDGRPRLHLVGRYSFIPRGRKSAHFRGKVRGWSERSAKRLRFITHNADVFFRSLVTLTYHALAQTWETDAERNRRVIERSAADRHRFLRCLADETGAYLWVREFQKRGVVHFHVLCEREVSCPATPSFPR